MYQSFNEFFEPAGHAPEKGITAVHRAILNILQPAFVVHTGQTVGVGQSGRMIISDTPTASSDTCPLLAYAPAIHPENLGNADFLNRYKIRYAYVAGAMAHGISSVELIKTAGSAGMIGFFGAAGLSLSDLEQAILRLKTEAADISYGMNLIFSGMPEQEMAMVNLYLKHAVSVVSAAGYLRLTLPLLYYRIKGIYRDANGSVVCPNKIIAKTSRLEIAKHFLSPPPANLVKKLLEMALISEGEAALAREIPVAQDLTAEADSGGHTDNRAAVSLLPSMIDLRDNLAARYQYSIIPCIGLGGGIATPKSVAAAFAMGADYVLTGSINQACIESGTSDTARQMLANALQTDVIMAPSANMFERGIKVQVLKRGSLFPQRAARLYDIYRTCEDLDQLPDKVKQELEDKIFQNSIASEWQMTKEFFAAYDPSQLEAAASDPKRKMALVFRSYLGKSSKWAIAGDPSRQKDYQLWCGPAMGAFNEWAKGSFLENPKNRQFETIAINLLFGACTVMRRQWIIQGLARKGLSLPTDIGRFVPMRLSEIKNILN